MVDESVERDVNAECSIWRGMWSDDFTILYMNLR